MDENEYISIAEFAERVNRSPQIIYKRIKPGKALAPYTKQINGNKYISVAALDFYSVETDDKPIDKPGYKPGEKEATESLNNALNFLKQQLDQKDKLLEQQQAVISRQNNQINLLQETTSEQFKTIAELYKQQNKLQENYQVLLARQQEMLLNPPQQEENKQVEKVDKPVDKPVETTESKDIKDKEHHGFFYWLFH